MTLAPDAAWQVLAARDARFDGRLFVGVTSTGVYCRPICRVRTPQRRHCRFFESAAQAEAAAFRPCLKCRPEIAPGPGWAWSVMDASRTLAHQAAALLTAPPGSDGPPSLAAVAARVGISERHLRRIFVATHGVTPLQYLQTHRLLLAKQLLTDTRLPLTQVALASGFGSQRRFNASFLQHYRMSPSRLRGAPEAARPEAGAVGLVLAYRAPYDHATLLRFVAQRAIPGLEQVDGTTIRRSLRPGTVAAVGGWIEAQFLPERARVQLRFDAALAPESARLVAMARRWLDLDAEPATIDAALGELPGAAGIRLPGSLDAFELAVRAVLGQQVSVAAARTLACRLVDRFGTPLATPWPDVRRAFPDPASIAAAEPEAMAALGIVRQRAATLVALARAWPALAPRLEAPIDPPALVAALDALPGIGAWTAHYIAMRAAGWPDAFPPGDVAVLHALRRDDPTLTPRGAVARAEAWRPWRAYAVLRLWNSFAPAS